MDKTSRMPSMMGQIMTEKSPTVNVLPGISKGLFLLGKPRVGLAPGDLDARLPDAPAAHHMADLAASLDDALPLILALCCVVSAQRHCSTLQAYQAVASAPYGLE